MTAEGSLVKGKEAIRLKVLAICGRGRRKQSHVNLFDYISAPTDHASSPPCLGYRGRLQLPPLPVNDAGLNGQRDRESHLPADAQNDTLHPG